MLVSTLRTPSQYPLGATLFMLTCAFSMTFRDEGPLSPHTFPSIRPSEAPVAPTAAWVPIPNNHTGGAFSVVVDFGQNYAGACELQLEGVGHLGGKNINLRYGEQLNPGNAGEQDLFHPWWPCSNFRTSASEQTTFVRTRDTPTQGDHNCANQTDRYIIRGVPGVAGFIAALGRPPMQTHCTIGSGPLLLPQVGKQPAPATAEVYTPSHAIKGKRISMCASLLSLSTHAFPTVACCMSSVADYVYFIKFRPKGGRWVQINGTAVNHSVRFAGFDGAGLDGTGADMCVPTAQVGPLVPCITPRSSIDVVITLRMWPLHSDVSVRGHATLHEHETYNNAIRQHAGDQQQQQQQDNASKHWSAANINALQHAVVRTHLNNLHSIPQDCPHREQRGWGGDSQLTAGSAALNFDLATFYTNWVGSMHDLQVAPGGNGDMPSYVPRAPGTGDKAPTWAAIAAVVPWEFQARTGDDSMAALGYSTAKKLIAFFGQHLDKHGLVDIVVYGDWNPSIRAGPNKGWGKGAQQPQMMSAHGSYIECLDRGVALATAAKDLQQAHLWKEQGSKARASFLNVWWNKTLGCFGVTCACQTCQAVGVALNVSLGNHSIQTKAYAALVQSVATWNTTLVSGIIGTRFIFEALMHAGHGDTALQLAGRSVDACAGDVTCTFSQQLAAGPGTLWEAWDHASVWQGGSLNHIMFGGGPGVFIYKAAGVTDASYQSDEVEIAFAIDSSVAKAIGGANVWLDGTRGECTLRWRVATAAIVARSATDDGTFFTTWANENCENGGVLMLLEVQGPVPRAGMKSWEVSLPTDIFTTVNKVDANPEVNFVAAEKPSADGTALVELVPAGAAGVLKVRASSGTRHVFGVCPSKV